MVDGSTPAGRLKAEIESWGSKRAFAEAMAETGVRGSTRTMIHRYLRGDPEPPPRVLRAAAEVLGVSPEYLIRGEGPRTETERKAALRAVKPARAEKERLTDLVLATKGLTSGTRELFSDAWRRFAAGAPDRELDENQVMVLGITLLELLDMPAKLWGFNHKLTGRQLNDFANALLHALMLAMPETRAGDSFAQRCGQGALRGEKATDDDVQEEIKDWYAALPRTSDAVTKAITNLSDEQRNEVLDTAQREVDLWEASHDQKSR